MDWFKFYGSKWLTDIRIGQLTPEEKLCFVTLLCVTNVTNARDDDGVIRHYDEEQILKLSGIPMHPLEDKEHCPYRRTQGFTQKLIALELVELDGKNLRVKNWAKLQNSNLTEAERAKRYRDKKKEESDDRHVDRVTNVTLEKSRVEKSRVDTTTSSTSVDYSEDFNAFWSAFPKKSGKGAAWNAWKKLKPSKALVVKIIESIEAHRNTKQWQKDGGQFIPHPATYLNQRRFEDEVEVTNPLKSKYAAYD